MDAISALLDWIANPDHWSGPSGVPNRLVEHIELSALAMLLAIVIALPIGLAIGHTGRLALVAVAVANLGRAVPSYALLLMLFPFFGFGFSTALPALVLLAIPPMLTNTYTGIREVDRDLVEAGRGMGMSERKLLTAVEVPIALPVIMAGIRTAAVQVVATAGLAALVAGGGLGRFIVDGFGLQDDGQLLAGAILVAGLAILVERVLTMVEGRMVSPGVRATIGRVDEVQAQPLLTGSG